MCGTMPQSAPYFGLIGRYCQYTFVGLVNVITSRDLHPGAEIQPAECRKSGVCAAPWLELLMNAS